MRADDDLKADLMERLDSIAAIAASDIEVDVSQGMVVLTGKGDSHQTKSQLERAVRGVPGMRGLAIRIKPEPGSSRRRVSG